MSRPFTLLPWAQGTTPLMLAPMQGLTNRAVREVFARLVGPDVVFTEFMRVRPGERRGARLSDADQADARAVEHGRPLVVQLIGRDRAPLVEAALEAQAAGAAHLNLNLGCPDGRMNVGCGGGMLKRPEALPECLLALREAVAGTFSVKVRLGYADPRQLFSLLPHFEAARLDFLVLHARTVVQRYEGQADHALTAEVVRHTRLPVIANGDVCTHADGQRVLQQTGAAGLMLGRGALRDPYLFERLRGLADPAPTTEALLEGQRRFLTALVPRAQARASDDGQALRTLKSTLAVMELPDHDRAYRRLRKASTVEAFAEALLGELHPQSA